MPLSQGWTRPRGSKRVHYVLKERTLCRRWTVVYRFFRLFPGPLALNPSFVARQTGRRSLCVDCVRRYMQLNNNYGLPVEPPEGVERQDALEQNRAR